MPAINKCQYTATFCSTTVSYYYGYFSSAFYYNFYYFSPSTLYFVGGLLHFEGDLLRVLYFEDGLHCIHEVVAA